MSAKRKSPRDWITGRNPVYEVLKARRRHIFQLWIAKGIQQKGRVADIIRLTRSLNQPVRFVQRQQLDKFGEKHQGVALETNQYPYSALEDMLSAAKKQADEPFFLLLDVIQNPQNLGTLLRTAEAVGVHGVIIPKRHAASVTPAVVNASAGASEHMLIASMNLAQAIGTLKENGLWIAGLDGGPDAKDIYKANLEGPLAIVVGSEGEGMRSLVKKSCDFLIRLPMRGEIESLNAAVAGSIALYMAYGARMKRAG